MEKLKDRETIKLTPNTVKINGANLTGNGGYAGTQKVQNEVGVRDYVSGKGYSGTVDWDGENVTVGGNIIKPTRVKDGTAYADASEVDEAIAKTEKRNGILGADGVAQKYKNEYGKRLRNAFDKLADREKFSYDPQNDPAYTAYAKEYTNLADNAYRNVLNDNNTSAYGATGAVLSDAMSAKNAYLTQLSNMIPQLEQNAFNRYKTENDFLQNNAELLAEAADEYYNNLHNSDMDRINNLNSAGKAEHDEEQRWVNNAQKRYENERDSKNDYYQNILNSQEIERNSQELAMNPQLLEEQLKKAKLDNEGEGQKNSYAAQENAIAGARDRGFFIRSDEKYLPWLANYRSANGYLLSPWEALARYEYDIAHAKSLAQFYGGLGM